MAVSRGCGEIKRCALSRRTGKEVQAWAAAGVLLSAWRAPSTCVCPSPASMEDSRAGALALERNDGNCKASLHFSRGAHCSRLPQDHGQSLRQVPSAFFSPAFALLFPPHRSERKKGKRPDVQMERPLGGTVEPAWSEQGSAERGRGIHLALLCSWDTSSLGEDLAGPGGAKPPLWVLAVPCSMVHWVGLGWGAPITQRLRVLPHPPCSRVPGRQRGPEALARRARWAGSDLPSAQGSNHQPPSVSSA